MEVLYIKAIFWGYIPLHRPYIGLIYGRYLQFRFLKWPLTYSHCIPPHFPKSYLLPGNLSLIPIICWIPPILIRNILHLVAHGEPAQIRSSSFKSRAPIVVISWWLECDSFVAWRVQSSSFNPIIFTVIPTIWNPKWIDPIWNLNQGFYWGINIYIYIFI